MLEQDTWYTSQFRKIGFGTYNVNFGQMIMPENNLKIRFNNARLYVIASNRYDGQITVTYEYTNGIMKQSFRFGIFHVRSGVTELIDLDSEVVKLMFNPYGFGKGTLVINAHPDPNEGEVREQLAAYLFYDFNIFRI